MQAPLQAIPTLCPCCSGGTYSSCCEPLLVGTTKAATPEQLMRSRYSAFYIGNPDYLLATSTAKNNADQNRQLQEKQQLVNTIQNTQWLGLRVLNSKHSKHNGEVEFVAFFKGINDTEQLHERSEFTYKEGWLYTKGEQLPDIKLHRNEPCYCGSGLKYKKCCCN